MGTVRGDAGFSLIEVVIAAFLLALVSTALAGAVMRSGSQAVRTKTSAQLQVAADAIIEKAREDNSWMRACTMTSGASVDCTLSLASTFTATERSKILDYSSATDEILKDTADLKATITAIGFDSAVDGQGARDNDGVRPDYFRIAAVVTAIPRPGIDWSGARSAEAGSIVSPWRSKTTGSLAVQVCGVGVQSDERMTISACDGNRTETIIPGRSTSCARFDVTALCSAAPPEREVKVAPMAGVSVTITPTAGTPLTSETDPQGIAYFTGLAPGEYRGSVASSLQLWTSKSVPGGSAPCSNELRLAVMKGQDANATAILRDPIGVPGCTTPMRNVNVRLNCNIGGPGCESLQPRGDGDLENYANNGGYWLRFVAAPFGRELMQSAEQLGLTPPLPGAAPSGPATEAEGWAWVCKKQRDFDNWLMLPYCAAAPTETHRHNEMHPVWRWHKYRQWAHVVKYQYYEIPRHNYLVYREGIWSATWKHWHYTPHPANPRAPRRGYHDRRTGCVVPNSGCFSGSARRDFHRFATKEGEDYELCINGGCSMGSARPPDPPAPGLVMRDKNSPAATWLRAPACRGSSVYYDVGTNGSSCVNDAWAVSGTWHTEPNWLGYTDLLCGPGSAEQICGANSYESGSLRWEDYPSRKDVIRWPKERTDVYSSVIANGYWPIDCPTPSAVAYSSFVTNTSLYSAVPLDQSITVKYTTTCVKDNPAIYDFPSTDWKRSTWQFWGGNRANADDVGTRDPDCSNPAYPDNAAIPQTHCTEGIESSPCPAKDGRYEFDVNNTDGSRIHTANYEPWCVLSTEPADGAYPHDMTETITNRDNRDSATLTVPGIGLYAGHLLKQMPASEGWKMFAVPVQGVNRLSFPNGGGPVNMTATTEGEDVAVPFAKRPVSDGT